MKHLLLSLLNFLFCFYITTFSQNPEWINNTNSNQTLNYIIPDFIVNDNDTNSIGMSAISVDYNGNFIITWIGNRNEVQNIYAQIYTVDGTPLGSNFKVNNKSVKNNSWEIFIASDSIGNFSIAWQDTPYFQIYIQRYSSDGNILGANFKVEKENELVNTFAPCISSNNIGEFVITWVEDYTDNTGGIHAQRYTSDGNPLGGIIKVTGKFNDVNSRPSVCVNDIGKFIIVWVEGDSIIAKIYAFDGIELGEYSTILVDDNAMGADHEITTSVSADKEGNFVVAWRDKDWNICAQRYSSEGVKIGEKLKLNDKIYDGNNWPPCIISVDSNGSFIVAWNYHEEFQNYAFITQRYSHDGERIGENFIIDGFWDMKLWNNRIYVTWATDGNIWAKVLDFNTPVGVEESNSIPNTFSLEQNYPNPFNPTTTIKYSIPKQSNINLKVFDVLGSEVKTLVRKEQQQSNYEIEFDGNELSSGIYFFRLHAGDFVDTKKMILLK